MANPNPDTSHLIMQKAGEPAINPKGRPKGSFDRTTIIKRVLELPIENLIDEKDRPRWLKRQNKKTVYEAMNIRMALSAINGDTQAYSALNKALGDKLDITTDGKPIKIALVEFVDGQDQDKSSD